MVGGGDSAMEEARFSSLASGYQGNDHSSCRDAFRASKIMLERAQHHPKIQFLLNTVVEDVYDVNHKEVTGLKLKDVKTGKVWDFPTNALFLGIGHEPNAKMFAGQLDTDADGYLKTHNYVFTKVHGVYACGDEQDRRYRQRSPQAPAAWLGSKWRSSSRTRGKQRSRNQCPQRTDSC